MRTRRHLFMVAGGAIAVGAIFAHPASAQDLAACGDIRLEAEAECELIPPSLDCAGECEPLALRAGCEAQLAVTCGGQCTGDIRAGCEGACRADCDAECEVLDPGEFSCQAQCEASCGAECDAECAADGGSASCRGSCMATCGASCDADCTVVPPSADCDAKCEAGCHGSCEAQANLACNIDCQADGFAECEAELQGGCELACQGDEGALFCDGQFVDPSDDIDACVAALRAVLDIEVSGYAESSAECSGGSCTAEASAGVSSDCSVMGPGSSRRAPVALAGLGLMIAALGHRRGRAHRARR